MLHLDVPTPRDLAALSEVRTDACVSIYLPTTPITQNIGGSRIELANLTKDAVEQLRSVGGDKRRIELLREELDDLADDDDYWRLQAHSLAIFVTPDSIRTFRLANRLGALVEVSDRFHLKPLIRAVTFPQAAAMSSPPATSSETGAMR
jgi:hypothetical protein